MARGQGDIAAQRMDHGAPARSDISVAGTVSDVRRKMDEMAERVNPEYFNYNDGGDLGLMPIETLKQQVRLFGEKILPHYR